MKSVFSDGPGRSAQTATTVDVPAEFEELAIKFVRAIREQLGGNEIRALAASQVASPVLQVRLANDQRDCSLIIATDAA